MQVTSSFIYKIINVFFYFRILSTPNEETWPGVSDLPDFKTSFPMWRGNSLKESCKALDAVGIDLLQVNFLMFFSFFFSLFIKKIIYRKHWFTCQLNE